MSDDDLIKIERPEVVPVEAVRALITDAVRDGIAEGVSRALTPIAEQLAQMSREMAHSNRNVATQLSQLADGLAGQESRWDEHDANAHLLDPSLAERQEQARLLRLEEARPSVSGSIPLQNAGEPYHIDCPFQVGDRVELIRNTGFRLPVGSKGTVECPNRSLRQRKNETEDSPWYVLVHWDYGDLFVFLSDEIRKLD